MHILNIFHATTIVVSKPWSIISLQLTPYLSLRSKRSYGFCLSLNQTTITQSTYYYAPRDDPHKVPCSKMASHILRRFLSAKLKKYGGRILFNCFPSVHGKRFKRSLLKPFSLRRHQWSVKRVAIPRYVLKDSTVIIQPSAIVRSHCRYVAL